MHQKFGDTIQVNKKHSFAIVTRSTPIEAEPNKSWTRCSAEYKCKLEHSESKSEQLESKLDSILKGLLIQFIYLYILFKIFL